MSQDNRNSHASPSSNPQKFRQIYFSIWTSAFIGLLVSLFPSWWPLKNFNLLFLETLIQQKSSFYNWPSLSSLSNLCPVWKVNVSLVELKQIAGRLSWGQIYISTFTLSHLPPNFVLQTNPQNRVHPQMMMMMVMTMMTMMMMMCIFGIEGEGAVLL